MAIAIFMFIFLVISTLNLFYDLLLDKSFFSIHNYLFLKQRNK